MSLKAGVRVEREDEILFRLLTGKDTPGIKSDRRLSLELRELGMKPFKQEGKIIAP